MALHYQLVFVLLVVEMATTLFLLLPLPPPLRKPIIKALTTTAAKNIEYYIRITIIFVAVLFIDAANRAWRLNEELHGGDGGQHQHHHVTGNVGGMVNDTLSRMFYSQRNVYLTGFTLFLSLVLTRLHAMLVRFNEMEDAILEQEQVLGSSSTESGKWEDRVAVLQAELDAKEAELAEARFRGRDLEMVRGQAERQNEEYMRLMDRFNELERKAEGRDGESRKGV